MSRVRVLSTRLSCQEAEALEELAARHERTPAAELRIATRRHVLAELAAELPIERLTELANPTPSEKSRL